MPPAADQWISVQEKKRRGREGGGGWSSSKDTYRESLVMGNSEEKRREVVATGKGEKNKLSRHTRVEESECKEERLDE